ncbi:hypothetical protein Scep_002801 [Stephania cephalantha]|uniref:Uncharacterized protein n=1 Tax=Stephania cephalantha TaxID=152367 RepID=A0AAP0LDE3_9MAGN
MTRLGNEERPARTAERSSNATPARWQRRPRGSGDGRQRRAVRTAARGRRAVEEQQRRGS